MTKPINDPKDFLTRVVNNYTTHAISKPKDFMRREINNYTTHLNKFIYLFPFFLNIYLITKNYISHAYQVHCVFFFLGVVLLGDILGDLFI